MNVKIWNQSYFTKHKLSAFGAPNYFDDRRVLALITWLTARNISWENISQDAMNPKNHAIDMQTHGIS